MITNNPAPPPWQVHALHRPTMRRMGALLLGLAACQFIAWAIPAPPGSGNIPHYLALHSLMETVSIVIAMMVFSVGWNSRTVRIQGNLVVLACLFFAIGCLDFSHTAAYGGMPDFFTPNGPDKHLNFWIVARLLASSALLLVTIRSWDRGIHKTAQYALLASLAAGVIALNWVAIYHQDELPALFIPGQGLTPLKKSLEYLCIAINLATMLLLWARMRVPLPFNAPLLFAAAAVMAMSEFFFTLYTTMTGAYNVLGHVYKVISYLIIYRAVVVEAVERPYLELARAHTRLDQAVDTSRQASRYLQNTLDAIPSLVAYWDKHLVNRFANKAYTDYFGITPEVILGQHISRLLGEDIYQQNLPFLQAALRGEEQNFERAIPSPDGKSTKYTKAKYLPDIVDATVQGIYVFVFDVSDIKATQEQLAALNVQLEQRTREAEAASASKSSFLANMSHEIRTPMNAILGLLNLLQSTALTDRQRDYASKTEGAAQSLLGLLSDILDFSKVEAGKLALESEPFRIDKLMRNLSVVLSTNLGDKNIEVLFDIDLSLPAVLRGDSLRLQQVLVNLGGNAVKFTAQGQVVLALRKRAQTAHTVTIEFSVQDTGIGIAPEHQGHIFSGFSQAEGSTTRRFGGTGLGLAISKRLVELMGGEIELTSQQGVGSTFAFSLELPTADMPAETRLDPRQPAAMPGRVLVVDDNPVAADLMLRMVRAWGWTADLARSGEEALALVSAQGATANAGFPYPVIYMDWKMPDMDGWEATRRIRQLVTRSKLAQPTVIMVTAHGRETLQQRTEGEQGLLNGFLVKPATASMLYDALIDAQSDNADVRKLARARSTSGQLTGMRILVVEDNPINQQVAQELLRAEGAIVSLAANGQLGVDAVAAAAPQFDAVLMDVQMPVLDGYGATRAIREGLRLLHLPIIAMTANAMASDRDACLAAGMDEHIGKPFDMAKLVALLTRLTGLHSGAAPPGIQDASAPSAAAPGPVPAVAGLDIQGALDRMSGMRSLYVRAVKDFVKSLPTAVPELQLCLRAGDRQRALMQLHTLKGNAATLGAGDLAASAASLEKLCITDAGMLACEAELAQFAVLVHSTQEKLQQAVALFGPEPVAAKQVRGAGSSGPVSKAAMDALQRISALAKASDMEVLKEFAKSRELMGEFPSQLIYVLDMALHDLDLEAAGTLCDRMLLQLPPAVHPRPPP